jgi:hypothetical protein
MFPRGYPSDDFRFLQVVRSCNKWGCENDSPASYNDFEAWGGSGHDVLHGLLGDSELHGEDGRDELYSYNGSTHEALCCCSLGHDAERDCDEHHFCETHL